tara:strand:+ start:98 stop:976 length:879 start_codon:yes stop_codon:yes gene_type:complete
MKKLWARWLHLLELREPGLQLALCRIMAGIGLVASVSFVLPHGTLIALWSDAGYRGGPSPSLIWILAFTTLLSGLLLALGLFTRIAAILSLVLFNLLIHLNPHDGSAYDSLLTNQLFLLIFSGAGATLSLDCKLRHGRWTSPTLVTAWPRLVMILQLVLCYWSTGVQKISGHWLPGGDLSAVYYTLQDPFWRRWDLTPGLSQAYPITQLTTAFSWWFEVLSPLLLLALYYRATADRPGRQRRVFNRINYPLCFAIWGILFHLGIHFFMRVGPFSWIILSYYPALFQRMKAEG